MAAVSALCLRDGAHAVLADLPVLRPPQGLRRVVQAFPLQAKLCTARAVKWAELCGPAAHSQLSGGNRGEVCGVALCQAGVCQAQAAVAHGEGELFRWWAVRAGLRHDGKGAVYRFALGKHHRRPNVLPRAAPGQVCNALLEAAMKDKPAVLVPQGECSYILYQEDLYRKSD
jgi:hypothetical protein